MDLTSDCLIIMSHVSLPATIPSGRYDLAFHHSLTKSCTLRALSISPASFMDSSRFFALLGVNRSSTERAASCPALSLSKQMTTLSKVSSHSRFALMSLLAPAAPDLMDTTGHFPSNISLTASASASPSVIVMYLPPLLNAC